MSEDPGTELLVFSFTNETPKDSGVWSPLQQFTGSEESARSTAQSVANSIGERVRVTRHTDVEVGTYEPAQWGQSE